MSRGEVRVCYVSSMYQLADVFTKAFSSAKFAPLRSKLRVVPPLNLRRILPCLSLSKREVRDLSSWSPKGLPLGITNRQRVPTIESKRNGAAFPS